MEMRQFRYLVALADEGSFTRAAAKVLVAQPALSQQIAKLEAELGLPLVDRTTRRVRMTEAGERLVGHARRVLKQVDVAREDMADLAGVRTGRLVIGASQTVGGFDLSGRLADFHRAHPAVDLAVREGLSVSLAARLRADELDLAFLTVDEGPAIAGLELHVVSTEELVAMLPPAHPLAGRRRLHVRDLAGHAVVTFRRGATIRRRLDEAAAAAGFELRVAFESNEVARMRSIAGAGLAIAVLPRTDAELPGPEITIARLADPGFEHKVYMSWREGRHHSPAARAFIELSLAGRDATRRPRPRPARS
jgi:LysR family transcriptional regulator, transcription activator of glutamate synthase operon